MQVVLPCNDVLSYNDNNNHDHDYYIIYNKLQETTTLSSIQSLNMLQILNDLFLCNYIHDDMVSLQCKRNAPLFSCLMSLANDVTMTTIPELWITNNVTQSGIINVLGESIDRYLWQVSICITVLY